ncbi:hypothetical protein NIES4103_27620 [Nostoc sp. NIES-4103]|nr:hypothetical protein NIES4103_27620 [Nostoc sp. NIES-4103]
MIKILGLDVSKSSVSACLLTEKPNSPRQFYYECHFYRFSANSAGINKLLELNADIALMEPTGSNYSKLWGTHLARAGVEVRLVGHKELRSYRHHHLALPDKDDDADALALACYYFDYHADLRRFVQVRDLTIVRVRELVLRLAHLNRVQSPIINRIRQDLAWQFPEVALIRSKRLDAGEVPLLWGWLAEERKSTRYDRLYQNTAGLGITDTVRNHAKRLCHLQREELAIERELSQWLSDTRFKPYCEVFRSFGFGDRLTAIVISQIYPLSGFLGEDGKPEVRIRQGRNSKKPTKRHMSLRRFQKALGVAPSLEASGDMKKTKVVGGSDLCRIAMWQWVFTRIEPRRNRVKNEIGKFLGEKLDTEKAAGRPIKLVRMKIAAIGARLLFRELVKALSVEL